MANNENIEIDVKDFLIKADGLLTGHFCLTSGLHSDTYFQCAKLYQYPDIVEALAIKLASQLKDVEFDTIVAPAIGAIIFGYEVARQAKKRNLSNLEYFDILKRQKRNHTSSYHYLKIKQRSRTKPLKPTKYRL